MVAIRRLRSGRVAVILPGGGGLGARSADPQAESRASRLAAVSVAALGAAWLGGFALLSLQPYDRTVEAAAPAAVAPSPEAPAAPATAVAAASFGTQVADAAMDGDVVRLRSLLEAGADANAPQQDGSTALIWAAYAGDLAAVDLLLTHGADPARATREGMTPLALAAINGDAAVIGRLLDAGADVNGALSKGETPLMLAARAGRSEAIELLLARGADVNAAETQRGTTALMWAAANGAPDVVSILVEHGADVSLRSKTQPLGRGPYLADTAKDRILDFQRGVGQAGQAIAVNLEADGEDLAQSTLVDEAIAEAARVQAAARQEEEREEVVLRGDGGGLTALVFAAREGDREAVRILTAAGADVNQTTAYGWTPLLAAVQNRYYQLAVDLLAAGADPNIANHGGWTPLYIATDNRNIEAGDYPTRRPDMDHLDVIKALLDAGANPNLRMASSTETRTIFTHQWLHEEGATPFLRAAQSGDLELMRLLLDYGADPNIPTEAGVTPLMVAAGIGWVEGVTYEWSPQQTFETVQFLLDRGADVNAQDAVDGRTALMGAAHKGRPDVIQLLVDRGADMSLRDIGSRDSIHALAGTTWQAIDYADGLVRVGVQSATTHPEAAQLLRRLMSERGLPVPPEGRTLESICVVDICRAGAG
jgi:ankyrin repeat protein